jgi:hypothetical protein
MKLKLYRYGKTEESTGGALHVNGEFHSHTCEDGHREIKVAGETRIPNGRYEIKLRDAGAMNIGYHERFDFHRGMLHLQDVPEFKWVYIHPLNNHKQTEGCIGVGYTALSRGGYDIERSEAAYVDLYQLVLLALDRGERIWIDIVELGKE